MVLGVVQTIPSDRDGDADIARDKDEDVDVGVQRLLICR